MKTFVVVSLFLTIISSCKPVVDCSLHNSSRVVRVQSFQLPDSIQLAEKIAINITVENPQEGCIRAINGNIVALGKDTFLLTAQLAITPEQNACKCLSDSLLYTTVFFEPQVRGAFIFLTAPMDGTTTNGIFYKKIIVQ